MMQMRKLLALCLIAFSGHALAEGGCPDGYYPANPPATNVCYPFPDSGNNSLPEQPRGRWENRWGAIAIDSSSGAFGAVKGARSKSKATKAAIAQCKSKGGSSCKVSLSYYNQCAVVAWGDTSYSPSSGPDVKETSQRALKNCSKSTTNCKIYYAECSSPEWIQ